MIAESVFLLAAVGAGCLVLVVASMAAGWALRSRQHVEDMRQLDRTADEARALRGRVHELTDDLAMEQRVVQALGDHLPDETVRTAVDEVTGAAEGRHGRD